ncbi:MAG: DUF3460 family protein [Burkholderiaceae bacterium]|jgi:hypothetical protein
MAAYESDISRFLRELKTARPDIEAEQLKGRSLWWDKAIDRDLQNGFNTARIAQKPYVYQPD